MDHDIIVCHEKHDTLYWDAQTPEAWASSSLAILTERWKQDYYLNPDNDGLGDSEWAEEQRTERAKALAMTAEQIAALPASARHRVHELCAAAKRDTKYDQQYREWWDRAKKVVAEQSTASVILGRGRYEREVPLAWVLLDERSDHEYERVELVKLQRAQEDEGD